MEPQWVRIELDIWATRRVHRSGQAGFIPEHGHSGNGLVIPQQGFGAIEQVAPVGPRHHDLLDDLRNPR